VGLLQSSCVLQAAETRTSSSVWIGFAVAVAANVSANTIFTIARYLAWRVRRVGQSGDQPRPNLEVVTANGRFIARITGRDEDAVHKGFYAGLATVAADPATTAVLLHLAAGVDPPVALAALITEARLTSIQHG
jgi:hypothetical protein